MRRTSNEYDNLRLLNKKDNEGKEEYLEEI